MSQQEQPRRPQEPVKYGDVFEVSGELADKTIAPEDANMMQAAETRVFGHTQKGGSAAVMQSAATANRRGGFVHQGDATDVAAEHGVTVAQTDVPGARVTTEFVGGQVHKGSFSRLLYCFFRNFFLLCNVIKIFLLIGRWTIRGTQACGDYGGYRR